MKKLTENFHDMKNLKIIPRNKYVLVEPEIDKTTKNEFGILIPENVEKEQKAIGLVLAVGKDVKGIQKGDKVLYGMYAGERIKMKESSNEVDYVLLFDEDILAFLK